MRGICWGVRGCCWGIIRRRLTIIGLILITMRGVWLIVFSCVFILVLYARQYLHFTLASKIRLIFIKMVRMMMRMIMMIIHGYYYF